MPEPHIAAAMSALDLALTEISAPHYPPPEEARHLGIALFHLVAAFNTRDFEPGEEAVWNCEGFLGGADWEIRLRQTNAASGMEAREGRDAVERLDGEAATARPDAQEQPLEPKD